MALTERALAALDLAEEKLAERDEASDQGDEFYWLQRAQVLATLALVEAVDRVGQAVASHQRPALWDP